MEIPTYYCIDCKTEMTPLDATKTSSSWRAAAGNFGKGLIMDIVIEAGIMIGTLVSILIFGLIWFVPGAIVQSGCYTDHLLKTCDGPYLIRRA